MSSLKRRELGKKRRRGRKGPFVGAIIGVAAVILTVGLFDFAASLPTAVPTFTTAPPQADAIVVLTGGSGRLEAGFRLLEDKQAKRLYISGVYKGVEVAQLLRLTQTAANGVRCCVELGHEAESTFGNAVETAAWMTANNLQSLLLVTANYHMPRSLLEFAHAMPERQIQPYPIRPKNVLVEKWWAWPGTLRLIATEYTKYLAARARIQLTNLAKWAGITWAEDI